MEPRIGALVLETITTGMYSNHLDAIREFVQNSVDSIRKAEEEGIIKKGKSLIEIRLDKEKKSITILDNGIGVPEKETYEQIVSIGLSGKNIVNDAGFRGIGRLAGIAYCDTLYFRTSVKGENITTTIKMNCRDLRETVSPKRASKEDLSAVLKRHCIISKVRSKKNEHFFEVIMEGVNDEGSVLLEWRTLEDYLGQVAPVPFDENRFKLSLKVKKWTKEHGLETPTVNIVIKSPPIQRQVFKHYETKYSTRKAKGGSYDFFIDDIRFFPEDASSESNYWLWYSQTSLLGMIKDELSAGFRVRKKNIALGTRDFAGNLFAEIAETNKRFNDYYIGEIHINCPDAIPNARRDGFEDFGAWPEIKQELMSFIRERCEEVRSTSVARNRPTEKLIASANKVINDVEGHIKIGISSCQEQDTLAGTIVKEKKKIVDAIKTRKHDTDKEKLLPLIKTFDNLSSSLADSNNHVKKKLSSLNYIQRKVIDEVLVVLFEALDEVNYMKAKSVIMAKYQIGRK